MTKSFLDHLHQYSVERVALAFNLFNDPEEKVEWEAKLNTVTARIISLTPYLAKVPEAERQSILFLSHYVLGIMLPELSAAIDLEDFGARIKRYLLPNVWDAYTSDYSDNEELEGEIIDAAYSFLVFIAMKDHANDVEEDKLIGKYNMYATRSANDINEDITKAYSNLRNNDILLPVVSVETVNNVMGWSS